VATYDGLYPLRLSQACDICDRSLEVIVKEGLILKPDRNSLSVSMTRTRTKLLFRCH
jgi:hypothetical protein